MEDQKFTSRVLDALKFPLGFAAAIWIIHLINFASGYRMFWLGIYPRQTEGLKGIITGPLIHGDFLHLFSNTLSFIILAFMIFFFYRKVAIQSFALIYLFTGFAVWIFARESFHIGASGVVYGLVSFVFWSGIFRRNIKSIVLALIVTVLYSGYFLGIVPGEEGVSWESHLLGGIVGILVAFLYRHELDEDERHSKVVELSEEMEFDKETYYFPPDIFDPEEKEDPNDFTGHSGFFK